MKLIISLLIDFINLAYSRDIFNCLLSFNSKEFLIEATQLCFSKVIVRFFIKTNCSKMVINNFLLKKDENLLKYYADLLNLIEKKDVCTHKSNIVLSQPQSLLQQLQPLVQQHQNQGNFNKNQQKDNYDDFFVGNTLKDKFYQIIYEFNNIDMLHVSIILLLFV